MRRYEISVTVRAAWVYEFGDFHLDHSKRVLLDRNGAPLSLTPKAYDTLVYLVEHAGAVVDRHELMQAVWPDTAVEDNNLNQNVSTLRRVLGEERSGSRYIATVPGRGYQFVAGVNVIVQSRAEGEAARDASIAVLPFLNFSQDGDFEYFCDGLADDLIHALSKLPQVRVAARTSAFSFKGKQVDIREIAGKLSVEAVLEGSVRKSGNRVRITAQLINASDGYQLWSERYEREMAIEDIFKVQDEITLAVVKALKLNLADREKSHVRQHQAGNVKAHELYLKGRFHLFRMTPSGIKLGLSYFQQSIQADPSDALAQVGLAHAYRMYALTLEVRPNEVLPQAKYAAEEAVRLNGSLAEAHAVLAFNIFWYEWAWDTSERHFKRALELDPNSADTHWMYAHLRSNTGDHEEALVEIARARELDPLSGLINAMEGQVLLHAGRTDRAIARLREAIELDPNSRVAHLFAASAYIEKSLFLEAAAESVAARSLSPSDTHAMALGAYAQAKVGKQAEAHAVLDQVLQLSSQRYVPPYHIAIIYMGLDETSDALAWLERGFCTTRSQDGFPQSRP